MFINIPENFSSTYGELLYEYQSTTSTDLKFTVTATRTDEVLGVKKLYDTTSATINVAPLVRNIATPKAERLEMGFSVPDHTSVGVEVECDDTTAAVRYFVAATEKPTTNTQLTTMPTSRNIAIGEQDSVLIHTSEYATLYAEVNIIEGGEVVETLYEIGSTDGRGVSIFSVNTSELASTVERVVVSISTDDHPEAMAELSYTIVPSYESSYRLAWVSSAGSIEHYTFPKVTQTTVKSDASREVTIVSGYELASTLNVMAEIVSSQGVWVARGEEYEEVEVSTSEVVTYRDGKLSLIELKVVENG